MRGQETTAGLLGRTLLLHDFGRYRLEKVLGGGLISQVYLGIKEANESAPPMAVKVLRPGEDQELQTRFRSEYITLLRLEAAETGRVGEHMLRSLTMADQRLVRQSPLTAHGPNATRYFPRALHFEPDYVAYGGHRHQVLVMEYVPAPPLSLVAAGYEGRRLPEEMALAAAEQYAQMLCILHSINLTCADRKLDDIRWREESEDDGQLIVLDWNVVDEGPAGRPADLFRFGLLWHQWLLGIEPRFERHRREEGQAWKLLVRLEREAGWDTLSFGTQGILRQALHPEPSQRYQRAEKLLHDVQAQRRLWQQKLAELWQRADSLTQQGRDLVSALKAVDVARRKVHAEQKEPISKLELLFKHLSTQVRGGEERQLQEVQRQIRYGQYDRAARLAADARATSAIRNNPELAVLLARHRILSTACARGVDAGQAPAPELREALLQASLELDDERRFDRSAQVMEDAATGEGAFAQALRQLLPEINLRRHVYAARALETRGSHRSARTRYLKAAGLVEEEEIDYWGDLVKLLGDPTSAAAKAEKASQEEREEALSLEELWDRGQQYLRNEQTLKQARAVFAQGLREDELENASKWQERALLAKMRWRVYEAKQTALDLTIFRIQELLKVFSGDTYGEEQRAKLRIKLLALARTQVAWSVEETTPLASATATTTLGSPTGEGISLVPSDEDEPWPRPDDVEMSLRAYFKAFADDDDFRSSLEAIVKDCAESVVGKSQEAMGWQTVSEPAVRRQAEDAWSTAWGYALRGKRLAEMLGQKWPDELSPDSRKARFEEALDERRAVERLRRCYPQIVGVDMGKEQALLEWAREHGLEPFGPGLTTQQLLEDADSRAEVRKQLDEAKRLFTDGKRVFLSLSPTAAGASATVPVAVETQEMAEEKMQRAAELARQALHRLEELEAEHERLDIEGSWQGPAEGAVDAATQSLREKGQQIMASIQHRWQERFDGLRKSVENALRAAHDPVAAEALYWRAAAAAEALDDDPEARAQLGGLRRRLDEVWRQATLPNLRLADEWRRQALTFQEEHPALALECLLIAQAKAKLPEEREAEDLARVKAEQLERLLAKHRPEIVDRLRAQLAGRVEQVAQALGTEAAEARDEGRMEDALTTLEQALFILPTLEIDKELLQERYDTKATRLVARALYSVSQKRFRQQPDLKALRDISNNLTLANRFDPSDDTIKALLDGVKGQLKERQVGRHEQLDQEWENLEDAWKAAIAKPEGLAEAAQLLDKLERISQADQRISQADPTWPTLLSEMRQQQTACEQFVEESKHVVALWGEYPEKLENKERGVAWLKECDDKTIVFMRSIESAEERIPASYWRELYQVLNDCLDAVGQDSRYRDHRAGLSYLIKWVQKRFRA